MADIASKDDPEFKNLSDKVLVYHKQLKKIGVSDKQFVSINVTSSLFFRYLNDLTVLIILIIIEIP
jgi:hypothetical protein